MRCRTPVIVSDIAAHRWVYGNAALYCDPYQAHSLERQIEQLLFPENLTLRDELIERGNERVKRYSRQTVADQWLNLFEKLQPKAALGAGPARGAPRFQTRSSTSADQAPAITSEAA